ncbi:MAG: WYL domain-containing protein [Saprospiraceae bacterium]|nr:WYL domain-containing protein [Saprospiraceae bacterium]MBP6565679.1 WYL domain-containing protein [Saprospiraceae bacterium]
MAISKFPLIRYKVLDRCFRTSYKKYFIDDLIDECNKVLFDMTGEEESVKLRQVRDDIAFMRSPEGWNIELQELYDGKKRIYRYEDTKFSIMNLPLNAKVMEEFRSSVEVLSQFEGMPQFDWLQESLAKMNMEANRETTPIISFDANPYLKGIEHLSTLYQAIKNKTVLHILYQDFNSPEPYIITLHPYHLKQYNNRWFLFGRNEEKNIATWNLAIDRMLEITASSDKYILNTEIDWTDYFDDIIGVTKLPDAYTEELILHFYGIAGKYVENKPIHGSQKSKWLNDTTLEIKLNLMINYELERLVLSYGESIKVISPPGLQQSIIKNLQNCLGCYH